MRFFLLVCLLILAGICGLLAHEADSRNHAHRGAAEAAYVRDPSHHCKISSREPAKPQWDYWHHEIETRPGHVYYTCDNDIALFIYDNEEQP